jgi:ribose transport system ATP-binding protein
VRRGAINWKQLERDAQQYIDLVELNLPARTIVGGLSAAQKQLVMIARSLSSNARILIMDEPTSALTRHETQNLLQLLTRIKAGGVAVLFVSHKLEEVLEVADKVSVLRDGKLIGTRPCSGLTKPDIVRMMIGRDARTSSLGSLASRSAEPALEARHIRQAGKFEDASFTLHKGEILGFYGLVGSGRTELAQLLLGVARKDGGDSQHGRQPLQVSYRVCVGESQRERVDPGRFDQDQHRHHRLEPAAQPAARHSPGRGTGRRRAVYAGARRQGH